MIINEKCSRIKAVLQNTMDASLADQYYITGKSGEKKRIALSRERTPHNDSSSWLRLPCSTQKLPTGEAGERVEGFGQNPLGFLRKP